MKLHPLIFAPAISLLSLTGCGGGSTPSGTLPETKTAINLLFATSPDDSYFASAQSEGESLALFANSSSPSAMSDALIYNNASDQVSFIRAADATSYNRMIINSYQFDYTETASGAEIMVTAPSGQQETYYVDSDGQLVQETEGNGEQVNSAVTSCIAATAESSFCMNLDPTFYPQSYCTVNAMNAQEGSDGMFTSVSYSTTALCSERGYPYNLSANNEEGWSAWFADPLPGSLSARSLFAGNPFDTSACHEQMYDDDSTWSTCINQQITAFTAHAQVGFSKIFRSIIELYYHDLLPAFEKASDYAKSVEQESDFSIEAATPKSFITDTLDDLLQIGKSTFQGLNKYFSDVQEGTYEENDPELAELLGKVWQAAEITASDNNFLGADTIECSVSSDANSFYYLKEGTRLDCIGKNRSGDKIFELEEEIGLVAPFAEFSENDQVTRQYLTTYNSDDQGYSTYNYIEVTNPGNDTYKLRRETQDYSSYLQVESGKKAYYEVPYSGTKVISIYEWDAQSYRSESCISETGDSVAHYKDENGSNSFDEACPFDISPDFTLRVHDFDQADIWLLNGAYKKYLTD